ncbi:MAG: Hsp70 family protein, partial [Candidatus Saccharimonas sp.]|nr:Hsp70 family protein [Planctomycetaceae bacterium]
ALALEAEQTKRSLSVRPKAALTCAAGGQRKTYQVELEQFERLTKDLVDRSESLTLDLLKEHNMGWAKIDVVLTTGGSSRMPMIRSLFKRLSGRTLNTSLSPDQSIAHGATYYAGMLLSNSAFAKSILNPTAAARLKQFKQHSATARALGVLIRDTATQTRIPHYILPANTPLPASVTQIYGTVSDNQRRVHLRIVESGTAADASHVELGMCRVDPLPENLPEATEIEVTIRYDEQARVHVEAKVLKTGQVAQTEIVRPENMVVSALGEGSEAADSDAEVSVRSIPAVVTPPPMPTTSRTSAPVESSPRPKPVAPASAILKSSIGPKPVPVPKTTQSNKPAKAGSAFLEDSSQPVPLCNKCGDPLDARGQCVKCRSQQGASKPASPPVKAATAPRPGQSGILKPSAAAQRSAILKSGPMALPPLPDEDDIIELEEARPTSPLKRPAVPTSGGSAQSKPKAKAPPLPPMAGPGKSSSQGKKPGKPSDVGEDEFWKAVES